MSSLELVDCPELLNRGTEGIGLGSWPTSLGRSGSEVRSLLSALLEWTGNGEMKEVTDTPGSGMSVSVVAGEGAWLCSNLLK